MDSTVRGLALEHNASPIVRGMADLRAFTIYPPDRIARSLRPRHVRLEPGTTKSGHGRTFPFDIFPELKALLKRQKKYTEKWQAAGGGDRSAGVQPPRRPDPELPRGMARGMRACRRLPIGSFVP